MEAVPKLSRPFGSTSRTWPTLTSTICETPARSMKCRAMQAWTGSTSIVITLAVAGPLPKRCICAASRVAEYLQRLRIRPPPQRLPNAETGSCAPGLQPSHLLLPSASALGFERMSPAAAAARELCLAPSAPRD
eukprot:CAMPEP_0197706212 /NCGR_PEP_ID=MMETSP1338-20131121/126831_1 /TAXON_ID=43686 ORGANISM="Pelagodinium beii, Strain RCC1491" /NCGR_SAMPLE_ID=MMETSP1338 /ASSEMBLY_ACC=CAM_ASM_000754 /LENGTH=133 /DNA_ID=CAMNT_0043290121 /DNA_START=141 /DNA_END=543 /DNA_ORIENTATION=-